MPKCSICNSDPCVHQPFHCAHQPIMDGQDRGCQKCLKEAQMLLLKIRDQSRHDRMLSDRNKCFLNCRACEIEALLHLEKSPS
jgi:hypothetical protein